MIFNRAMVSKADLPANRRVMTKYAGTRDTGLRRDYGVCADLNVVPNVHQIVEFYSFADAGVVQ